MPEKPSKHGELWSEEELILAFDLYCRIPFKKTKASNPQVKTLASLLGRTPASVARKLGNFGAYDPELQRRGIVGLVHGSKLDKIVWDKFHSDWGGLAVEAKAIENQLSSSPAASDEALVDVDQLVDDTSEQTESLVLVKKRIRQSFFRESVLSSFNSQCCITGITIMTCLDAAHILSWKESVRSRTDPRNGLCISKTFHALFDAGLITIDEDLRILFSSQLLKTKEEANNSVLKYHNSKMILPERFMPLPEYLQWHREQVFVP